MDTRRAVNVTILIAAFTLGIGAAAGLIALGVEGSVWHSVLIIAVTVAFVSSLLSLELGLYMLLLLGITEGIYKTIAPSLFTLAAKDIVLMLILLRLIYISLRNRDFSWFHQRLSVPAVLFTGYVVAMAVAPSTSSPALALAGIRAWLLWLPVYYPIWVVFDSKKKVLRLLHALSAICGPLVLYGIYQRQMGFEHLAPIRELYTHSLWHTGRAMSIFNSPHIFGGFSAVVTLSSLGLALYHRKMPVRLLCFGAAIVAAGGVLASDVRSSFLGLVSALVVFFLLARHKLLIGFLVTVTALLSWNYLMPEDIEGTSKLRHQTSTQIVIGRVVMPLERAIEQVTEYPLGYGVATGSGSGRIFGKLRARAGAHELEWIENELGRALTELGLPGSFFWLWLLWIPVRTCIRAVRSAPTDADHYLLLGMTAAMFVMVSGLAVGSALYDGTVGIYFWVFAAIIAHLHQLQQAEAAKHDGVTDTAEEETETAPQSPVASAIRGPVSQQVISYLKQPPATS